MTAILWDMDGTLVDSEPMHEAALEDALASLGLTPPDGFHDALIGRDAAAVHAYCVETLGATLPLADWLALKYRSYFARIADGVPGRDRAPALFLALRAAGVKQAVVSNSDRLVVSANLAAAGLDGAGAVTVARNDVRAGKPDPEGYLRAAWLLRAEPADCVVLEDSPTGAQAGVAAGMTTLYWPQPGASAPAPAGARHVVARAEVAAFLSARTGAALA